MELPPEPRKSTISVPLPENAALPPDVRKRLTALHPTEQFADVRKRAAVFPGDHRSHQRAVPRGQGRPQAARIHVSAHRRQMRPLVRGPAQSAVCRTTRDDRCRSRRGESDGPVEGLDEDSNLACKAAEEITADISITDATLKVLLDRFGSEGACEIIMLVSWFNMLIRYVESTRVPYEPDPAAIISGGAPLALKSP